MDSLNWRLLHVSVIQILNETVKIMLVIFLHHQAKYYDAKISFMDQSNLNVEINQGTTKIKFNQIKIY